MKDDSSNNSSIDFRNNSSIMRINENKDEVVSALNFNKTHVTINEPTKGTLGFWFKRSDFYITGMNFVFSRIALMC